MHKFINGKHYIEYADNCFDVPIRYTLLWPVGWIQNLGGLRLEDVESEFLVTSDFAGGFRSAGGWLCILRDGGKTLAERKTEEPIPAPKTRLKTEYKEGAWHKIHKNGRRERVPPVI
jgi:hypothetical protein